MSAELKQSVRLAPTRPVVRYHGGKWNLAPWIISYFPPHRIYVEPFGGAGSVLLQKPVAYAEIYNDIEGEIVNVFRVLRDRRSAKRLEELLRLTPFARDEWLEAYESSSNPIERARRMIIRAYMGFGSAATNPAHSTGFRASANRSGTTPAHDWANFPSAIGFFTQRLSKVCIENRPALQVIQSHDSVETLFYLDPPYVRAARAQRQREVYRHELSDDDHRDLARVLHSVKGMAVLSGYRCALYTKLFKGWLAIDRECRADGARPRTETLWLNARAEAGLSQGFLFRKAGGG